MWTLRDLFNHVTPYVPFRLPRDMENWLLDLVHDHTILVMLLSSIVGLLLAFSILVLLYHHFPRIAITGFFYRRASTAEKAVLSFAAAPLKDSSANSQRESCEAKSENIARHRTERAARRAQRKAKAVAAGAALPQLPKSHPGLVDPVAALQANETNQVPFQCPFMEAFKEARRRDEKIIREAQEAFARGERPPCPKFPERVTPGDDKAPTGPPSALELSMARALVRDAGNHLAARTQFDDTTDSDSDNEQNAPITKSSCLNPTYTADDLLADDIKEFYEHIPAFVKSKTQEKILSTLTSAERAEEAEARSRQMAEILSMMQQGESNNCGISCMEDLQKQMRMYVK